MLDHLGLAPVGVPSEVLPGAPGQWGMTVPTIAP